MRRDLTRWALSVAVAVALSACDEDPGPSPDPTTCGSEEECEDASRPATRADAGKQDAATRDASASDASAPDASARDAGAKLDAAMASDAAGGDAASDAASSTAAASLASLRQVCVDTINMYRATKALPPMMRASATSESCSDDGAAFDSKANKAHGSAAKGAVPCRASAVAQNTCPNWTVSKGGTVADTLTGCLKKMWEEGEPPGGVKACTDAYFAGDTACFLAHGHYINMISDNEFVSCGFYVNDKQQWWMNQDFTSR